MTDEALYTSPDICSECFNNPEVFTSHYTLTFELGMMAMAYVVFGQKHLCSACMIREIENIVENCNLRWFHEGRRDILEKEYDLAKATAMSKAIQKRLKLEESK